MRRSISQPLIRSCERCKRPFSTSSPPPTSPASTAHISQSAPLPTRTRSLFYNGRFHNPWPSFKEKTLIDRLSDLRRLWAERPEPKHDHFNPTTYPPHQYAFPAPYDTLTHIDLDTHLPLHTPDFDRLEQESEGGIGYTWLGHATSVVQVNGLTILTDPWFSQRASAWQRVGPRRFRPPACTVDQLPPLDVILISHSHFDHLDYNSVRTLHERVSNQHRDTWPSMSLVRTAQHEGVAEALGGDGGRPVCGDGLVGRAGSRGDWWWQWW